jgi:hypothetical protein
MERTPAGGAFIPIDCNRCPLSGTRAFPIEDTIRRPRRFRRVFARGPGGTLIARVPGPSAEVERVAHRSSRAGDERPAWAPAAAGSLRRGRERRLACQPKLSAWPEQPAFAKKLRRAAFAWIQSEGRGQKHCDNRPSYSNIGGCSGRSGLPAYSCHIRGEPCARAGRAPPPRS